MRRLDEHVHARAIAERNNIYMSDFANDDLKTEPVSDRAGQLQHLRESDHGLGTRIPGAFWGVADGISKSAGEGPAGPDHEYREQLKTRTAIEVQSKQCEFFRA